jgi:predicted ATPase
VQTNWYVFTGAACCGKTTLIESLSERGYAVIAEGARQYFSCEMAKGRSLEEIRRDDEALQRVIFDLQLKLEQQAQASVVTFLDRALPDSLTFYRVFGMDPNLILAECFTHHYAGVFILDRLPFRRNQTLGPEDNWTSDFLDAWLTRDYQALGYGVVRVPVLPPEERLEFVLHRLSPHISLDREQVGGQN